MARQLVLFVCTGNTCRSLMAEKLFNQMAAARKLPWAARSCGLCGDPRLPIPEGVRRALKQGGLSSFEHKSSPVTAALLSEASLVLTMTRDQLDEIVDRFPAARAKTSMFTAYAGLPAEDVPDPIGQDDKVYEACRRGISAALEALLNRLPAGV